MLRSVIDHFKLRYHSFFVAGHLHRNDALGALHRAWGYVYATQLAGDYYEFGVYHGSSLIHSWFSQQFFHRCMTRSRFLPFECKGTVAHFLRHTPSFYGFDTFCGMPENNEGEDSLAPGSFQSDMTQVLKRCAREGLQSPTLHLVPGLFTQTCTQLGDKPAAIVHLDCDLYSSSVDALAAIAPKIVQGTVLLCDDYNLFRADRGRGERRALAEFLRQTNVDVEPWFAYGPASMAFLCHR